MTDTEKLRKMQLVEKEILICIMGICKKYSLNYFIIGGTLIGAVRHKGFIPWDDDIDIGMPREDYNKFIKICSKELSQNDSIGLSYYKDHPDDDNFYYYPIRVINKKYNIKENRLKDILVHPWIDILPIDGRPNSNLKYKFFKFKMLYYRMMIGLHYVDVIRDVKRTNFEKIIIKFGKFTKIGKIINPTKYKDKIDKLLSSNKIEDCDIIGTCMGAYSFREFVPKEYFGKGTQVKFEGLEVNAPEKIHEYLTHMYGDYMELPPIEKRKTHVTDIYDV